MQVNLVSKTNFGLQYTDKLTDILNESRNAAKKDGTIDAWEKAKNDLDETEPKNSLIGCRGIAGIDRVREIVLYNFSNKVESYGIFKFPFNKTLTSDDLINIRNNFLSKLNMLKKTNQ